MKNHEIERRLRQAAEQETPDVLDNVLRQLGKEQSMELTLKNNNVIEMPAYNKRTNTKTRSRVLHRLTAVAAMVAVVLGLSVGYLNLSVDSVVAIDVNPSVELKINRNEKILSVNALNEDAKLVLDGMNLRNVDLNVAVNAIIGSMLQHGYLGTDDNAIFVSVENNDTNRSQQLSNKLTQEINTLLDSKSVTGRVMAHTLSEDQRLEKLAEDYNISLGKAALADLAVSESGGKLTFDEAVKLSVKELWAAVYPETAEFVTLDTAKASALAKAGLKASEVTFVKERLYKQDNAFRYELEMHTPTHKYVCSVDALTGKVVEYYSQKLQAADTTLPSGLLTDDKILEIVYADAKVLASQVTLEKCKLDYDDGTAEYEVDFRVGKTEYDYEVDAKTGKILKKEIDRPASASTNTGSTSTTNKNLLSESQALSKAYADAGVKASQVTLLQCKLDEDYGIWTYEIEFKVGRNEYDYELNAKTGAVLDRDIDLYEEEYDDRYDDDDDDRYDDDRYEDDDEDDRPAAVTKPVETPAASSTISRSKALSIAYAKAGVSGSNVYDLECELDNDDGRSVYDISFSVGNAEYDFEINALTGAILDWEKDIED